MKAPGPWPATLPGWRATILSGQLIRARRSPAPSAPPILGEAEAGGSDSYDAGRAAATRPSGDFVVGYYLWGSIVCKSMTDAGDVGFSSSYPAPSDSADRYEALAGLAIAGDGSVPIAGEAHRATCWCSSRRPAPLAR